MAEIQAILDQLFMDGPWLAYALLFAACFIENIVPPFPGDAFVLAAGGLIAIDQLQVLPTMAVVLSGGLSSVSLLYWFGRLRGRDYLLRRNFRWLSAMDIVQIETRLQRWGALILLASRFVPGVRPLFALVAGIGRYPAGSTVLYTGISYLLFTGLLLYIAATLVENSEEIERFVRTYNLVVWPLMITAVTGYIIYRVRRARL